MPEPFMFATGIENSYPTIQWQGKTVRPDEMQECGHYQRWREDFGPVKNLGLQYLRYGPPFYNERRFLSLDLTYGHTIDVVMYRYLMDNGMTPEQFDWFHTHHVKRRCIMGNDLWEARQPVARRALDRE